MIRSAGIDLAGVGEHKVRCLDEEAQICDGFGFDTTPEGLAKLEERVFRDGSNPVIVFEPIFDDIPSIEVIFVQWVT